MGVNYIATSQPHMTQVGSDPIAVMYVFAWLHKDNYFHIVIYFDVHAVVC